jgi:hypothetical protein
MFEKRMKGYKTLGYGDVRRAFVFQASPPSGACRSGNSFPSGWLTLSESIRAAGEIPFEVDIVEKDPHPTGAKGRRKT